MYHLLILSLAAVPGATPTTLPGDIDINSTLLNICNIFAGFAGAASALAFLRAGFLYMFGGDNVQQETAARRAFAAACIGLVICLGAVTLAHLVTGAIK